jgi:polar amino acid transport system permease protein
LDYVFQFREVLRYWPWLLEGVATTLAISLAAMALSVVVGTAGALARRSRYRLLRLAVAVYVDTIRNTPFLVQLFLLYFGLPSLGIRINSITAGLIGVVLYNSAFTTEIIRSGLQAIHRSQIESGLSIGMSRAQVFFYVVMVPALETVYPALSSQFVLLMLGTSIISAIGVNELTSFAGQIQSLNFRSIEVYIVCIVIYLIMTMLLRGGFRMLGRALFAYRNLSTVQAAQ